MFFRIKPSGPRRYLQLVENTRDGAATGSVAKLAMVSGVGMIGL